MFYGWNPEAKAVGYSVFDSTPTSFIIDGNMSGGEMK